LGRRLQKLQQQRIEALCDLILAAFLIAHEGRITCHNQTATRHLIAQRQVLGSPTPMHWLSRTARTNGLTSNTTLTDIPRIPGVRDRTGQTDPEPTFMTSSAGWPSRLGADIQREIK